MLRLILTLILAASTTTSFAGVKIIFLNGIDGSPEKNYLSILKIKTILSNNGHLAKFHAAGAVLEAWHNHGDGSIDDKAELYAQSVDSGVALTTAKLENPGSQPDSLAYKTALGNLYFQRISSGAAASEDARHVYSIVQSLGEYVSKETLVEGNKLIVVSHSQGNFFAEAVDAYVRRGQSPSNISILNRNLRFVGAASVASSTPNNRYISVSEDIALDLHSAATATIPNFSLLPRNSDLCPIFDATCSLGLVGTDYAIHGFQEIYTSDLIDRRSGRSLSSILAQHISDSFDEIVSSAPPTTIGSTPGSASAPGPVEAGPLVWLQWQPSVGATYYRVAVTDDATGALVVDRQETIMTTLVRLSPGSLYRWSVAACNAAGCSAASTPLFFQTSRPTVSAVSCTSPVVGLAMTCTVTGSSLPESGMTLTATNCTPSVMTQQAGGSAGGRTFSCVPTAQGTLAITGITVPGYSGVSTLPSYTVGLPPSVVRLLDTGITSEQCYQAGSNTLVSCTSAGALALSNTQDGMLGRDADPAANSSADGQLGFSYSDVPGFTRSECVKDNLTGLMWEGKTADGGLRDGTKTYTNFADGRVGDATAHVSAVNAVGLCGFTDWRLPKPEELETLLNYSALYGPAARVDAIWFPNTVGGYYWSSLMHANFAGTFWSVDFDLGSMFQRTPANSARVRLVRGATAVAPSDRYVISADEAEVTDTFTGLIWSRCPAGGRYVGGSCFGAAIFSTQDSAFLHAKTVASSSGKAWRLPNVKELLSIVDRTRAGSATDPVAFPEYAAQSDYFTSTPSVDTSEFNAFIVRLYAGYVGRTGRDGQGGWLRLVRTGP